MKKNVLKSIVLFGGILFLSASCVKEIESKNDTYRPAGSPIVFAAETGYDNGIATRTAYSGEAFDVTVNSVTKQFERIDWVAGDKVKVCYLNTGASAVYTVGSPSANNEQSAANLSSQSSMTWDEGDDDHVFYAMYPDVSSNSGHGTNSNASLTVSPNGALVRGVIPDEQTVYQKASGSKVYNADMVYGYLVSKKTIDAESTATSVELPFRPATTTFQFQFKTASGSAAVSSFEMSSTTSDLTGKFTFDMKDGYDTDDRVNPSWGTVSLENTTKKITVTFDQSATITSDVALDFTVFALPVDITNVTLKFNFADGTSKTLPLKREGVFDTFNACKKYIITNAKVPGNGEWVYTLTEVDPTTDLPIPVTDIEVTGPAQISGTKPFKSYKTNTQTNEQALVDVEFQYAPVLSNGTPGEWSNTLPTWLSQYVVTHRPDPDVPGDPQETPTTSWMSQMDFTVMNHDGGVIMFDEIDEHTRILRNDLTHPANGFTSSSPQDLSLYEINSLTSPRSNGKPKTANCYVVDRRGWYMFPLVYGNAIDWDWAPENGWNTSSWRDNDAGITGWSDAPSGYKLRHFQNYVDNPISSPYILNDIGFDPSTQNLDDLYEAVIVWEDVETPFISTSSVQIISPYTESTTKYVAENGSTKVVVPYIKFQVNGNIMQGNALIALREKTGDKRIIWSWHIWITDLDMNTLNVSTHEGSVVSSNDMLQYHIGWCDMRIGRKYSYEPRVYYVKISHTEAESDADPLIFKVTETAPPFTSITVSCGTTYEAGRKDPFLPGMSEEHFWVEGQSPIANWTYINKPVYSPTYGTITVGNNRVLSQTVTSSMDNMSHTIQHPYIVYSGGFIGWLNNHRPRNLWNMRDTDDYVHNQYLPWHQKGTLELDYSPQYQYDVLIWKTVYDPCPPGFSVPNYTFATGFTTTGYNIEWQGTDGWHVSDAVWIPADAEVYPDVVIDGDVYGDFRTYLSTNSGTMCFPGSGDRDGSNGKIENICAQFFLMSGKFKGDRYVVSFNNVGPVGAGTSRVNCYAIRPVREQPRPTD